jgi:acetate kinase
MKILVINSGSSSVKYSLMTFPEGNISAKGMVERIGLEGTRIQHTIHNKTIIKELPTGDHKTALQAISNLLLDSDTGALKHPEELSAVGHRVVHGGITFSDTVKITKAVKEKIRSLFSLAPLHNPPNLAGIEVSEKIFPHAAQIAVFDTAFHQSIPDIAHRYAIPEEYYDKYHVRVFGFHGTSHKYVSGKLRTIDPEKSEKIISLHLGNGCSMTAIFKGKSIDHSLGFGPMNGLIMGSRSGDIDPAAILYLMEKLQLSPSQMTNLLQKESGLLGITGMSDMRDIEKAAGEGNIKAQLALEMTAYRIRKYIGAYTAVMNGLDALIFTAGIGENSAQIRAKSCDKLDFLGIKIDPKLNNSHTGGIASIHHSASKVKIWIIPTDEEREIARQTYELLQGES